MWRPVRFVTVDARGGVCWVATRDVFSPEELAQLRGSPEIDRAALIRH